MKKLVEWIATAVWIFLAGFFGWCEKERTPCRYLLPEGFTGWVVIEYEVEGAPELPVEDGYFVYRIPASGVLRVSSSPEEGGARDEYFYVGLDETRRGIEHGLLIHGEAMGRSRSEGVCRLFQWFFVGPRETLEEPAPDGATYVDEATSTST